MATASRSTVWAILTAEPPGGCRRRAELVAEDGGAHPNEREVTVQAAATGGATIPQHGHRVHEEVSVDVVVLQWQAGGHGAGMGSARALVGARGAIFKDVLESVARNVARNGIFHLRWD